MERVLITGLSGFVGHHVAEGVLKNTDWEIVALDRYHHSGTLSRITEIDTWEKNKSRVTLLWHDLRSNVNSFLARDIGHVDYIYHIAASSHVDRSIEDPMSFVMDNVVGTCNLLNFARQLSGLKKFSISPPMKSLGPPRKGWHIKSGTDSVPAIRTRHPKRGEKSWRLPLKTPTSYRLSSRTG